MLNHPLRTFVALCALPLLVGCATGGRPLMPTPTLYQQPGGQAVFNLPKGARPNPDLDLLFVTNRGPLTPEEKEAQGVEGPPLPYGQERARRIAFGSAQVRVGPGITWGELARQSQLGERTRPVELTLGEVRELGAFPTEPYQLKRLPNGFIQRDLEELKRHDAARGALIGEVQRRLASAPRKEVLLYVHGFNETFATAAYTAAELCHFLGREQVCGIFTWPASTTGNFLISYTTTTESADFAVEHLKKTIRMIAETPGVEGLQLLAHSRGTAVMLRAVRELALEAISAGKEPLEVIKIDNLVLLSPDIDVDVAAQLVTGFLSDPDLVTVWPHGRLPRILKGRLSVYASPEDRALRVSQILFRSRNRVGQLRPEDIPPKAQHYFETLGRVDLLSYQGERTDLFGHSYFTTNPRVSSDLIQLIRHGKKPGEPGRDDLVKTGPVTWEFPPQP